MSSGISKYRVTQEALPKKAKKKSGAERLLDDVLTDRVSLSQAALEQLQEGQQEEGLTYEEVIEPIEESQSAQAEERVEDDVVVSKLLEQPLMETKVAEKKSLVPNKNQKPKEKEEIGTREEIIREYSPLIKFIAQKIAARLPANIELDDLISSGVIGLMDAIEKYDPSRDNKFKTYAEFRIRGAILDELRAQDWVPRSVREKAKMLERTYSRLEQDLGRPASDEEVCEALSISQEEFYDLLNQVRSVSLLSYDDLSNMTKGDRKLLSGIAENGKSPTPFSEVNLAHVKKLVATAINDLPEKQRLVLSLYYYEDLNLKEIGKVLEVTESRVSQLHTQAIIKLKTRLKNHFDEVVMLLA